MNVSNHASLAGLFRQNNMFQQGNVRLLAPSSDALKRLSDNLITAQDHAEELNKISSRGPSLEFYGSAYDVLVPDGAQAKADERWHIDPTADDIYGEIDRALASTHKAMSIYEDIGTRVSAELKRRGIHESEVEFPTRSAFENMEHWSPFQDIYEKIRRNFLKSI